MVILVKKTHSLLNSVPFLVEEEELIWKQEENTKK